MSQTIPVDVVSRSYWAYVASAMAEGLSGVLSGAMTAAAIPARVYVDAQHFFELVLEAAGDNLPNNPSASISNYLLAADAARAVPELPTDRPSLRSRLQEYAALLTKLRSGDPLQQGERDLAKGLQQFFSQVQQEAEAEAYGKVVEFDQPRTTTLKLF